MVMDSTRELSQDSSLERRSERRGLILDTAGMHGMDGLTHAPLLRGRVFNIALIGVDSRLGMASARADAIHVLTISPDSGIVEILSVPRGTYAEAGFGTARLNIISYARRRGMHSFLTTLSTLCGRGPITQYIEVGFSQVLGILELLGYKDPESTLRFLRSRKTFRTGDIQRSHNQSIFLRDNLINKFTLLTGGTGKVLVGTGLRFVSTNLTPEFCEGMIHALRKTGFPNHRPDAVRVRMLPCYRQKLLDLHATEEQVRRTAQVSDRIVGDSGILHPAIGPRLRQLLALAVRDSARPRDVVRRLRIPIEQRIWWQVRDERERRRLRAGLVSTLIAAYRKLNRVEEVQRLSSLEAEEDVMRQEMRE